MQKCRKIKGWEFETNVNHNFLVFFLPECQMCFFKYQTQDSLLLKLYTFSKGNFIWWYSLIHFIWKWLPNLYFLFKKVFIELQTHQSTMCLIVPCGPLAQHFHIPTVFKGFKGPLKFYFFPFQLLSPQWNFYLFLPG